MKELFVKLTYQCNINCGFCSQNNLDKTIKPNIKNISESYTNVLSNKDNKIDTVRISGGEPLLYKDHVKYLSLVGINNDCSVTVLTNGLLLDDDIVKFFNDNNIHCIISCHSLFDEKPIINIPFDLIGKLNKKSFNKVVSDDNDNFDKTVNVIHELFNCNVDISFDSNRYSSIDINLLFNTKKCLERIHNKDKFMFVPFGVKSCKCSDTLSITPDGTVSNKAEEKSNTLGTKRTPYCSFFVNESSLDQYNLIKKVLL